MIGSVLKLARAAIRPALRLALLGAVGLVPAAQAASGTAPIRSSTAAPESDADCAQARAHFEIARDIGTRAALKVHIDAFPDCSFAPLAQMLMKSLPDDGTEMAEPGQDGAAPAGVARAAPGDGRLPKGWSYDLVGGHTRQIAAVAYSADGRLIATGADDQSIRLWDAASGKLLRVLAGHGAKLDALAFSPSQPLLASSGEDGTVRLWDSVTGAEVGQLPPASGSVASLAFDPTGRRLAGASFKTIVLWAVDRRAEERVIAAHDSSVNVVAFSSDGTRLASASFDKSIKIWDPETGALVKALPLQDNNVGALAFAQSGRVLASAAGPAITLWDVASGSVSKTLDGHKYRVFQIAASPDGRVLASAGGIDGTTLLWDAATGALLKTLDSGYYVNAVAFSPDGRSLVSGLSTGSAVVWDVEAGTKLRQMGSEADSTPLTGFGDGDTVFSVGSLLASVAIWDPQSGAIGGSLKVAAPVSVLALSPDGSVMADATYSAVEVRRLSDPETVRQIPVEMAGVAALAISPDNRLLAIGNNGGTVLVWDLDADREAVSLDAGGVKTGVLAFSPDGTLLAAGSDDKSVRLWDVASHALVQHFKDYPSGIGALDFSPDGASLAIGSYGPVEIREVRGGAKRSPLAAVKSIVQSLRYTPDGASLAVADYGNRAILIIDAASGRVIRSFEGHDDEVSQIRISADGSRLVSTSGDDTTRLWDLASGRQIASFVRYSEADAASVVEGRLWTSSPDAKGFIYVRKPDGAEVPLLDYEAKPASTP